MQSSRSSALVVDPGVFDPRRVSNAPFLPPCRALLVDKGRIEIGLQLLPRAMVELFEFHYLPNGPESYHRPNCPASCLPLPFSCTEVLKKGKVIERGLSETE